MISRVLVAMDDSEMGERTLEYALEAHPDAETTVLYVVGGPSTMGGQATGLALSADFEEATDDLAREVFESAREIAAEHDAEITTEVQVGHPVRVVLNQADAYDTVVIGAHTGSVADRLFIGNVAEKVFRRSPVPVTVVR